LKTQKRKENKEMAKENNGESLIRRKGKGNHQVRTIKQEKDID